MSTLTEEYGGIPSTDDIDSLFIYHIGDVEVNNMDKTNESTGINVKGDDLDSFCGQIVNARGREVEVSLKATNGRMEISTPIAENSESEAKRSLDDTVSSQTSVSSSVGSLNCTNHDTSFVGSAPHELLDIGLDGSVVSGSDSYASCQGHIQISGVIVVQEICNQDTDGHMSSEKCNEAATILQQGEMKRYFQVVNSQHEVEFLAQKQHCQPQESFSNSCDDVKGNSVVTKAAEPDSKLQAFGLLEFPTEKLKGTPRVKKAKAESKKAKAFDWDSLRKEVCHNGYMSKRSKDRMDSLDWDAVRWSDVREISETIRERGMNNVLAERIKNLQNYMLENTEFQEGEMEKALVAITNEAASIPMPKLKNVKRLRTEHLLMQLEPREYDDPCPYLLSIWSPGKQMS
ncbi:hypothetical protein BHE74_00042576 [Ensete ventricosum]|nr:hypothetical protein BHE74_00042576 [Ensete ventricosum]